MSATDPRAGNRDWRGAVPYDAFQSQGDEMLKKGSVHQRWPGATDDEHAYLAEAISADTAPASSTGNATPIGGRLPPAMNTSKTDCHRSRKLLE